MLESWGARRERVVLARRSPTSRIGGGRARRRCGPGFAIGRGLSDAHRRVPASSSGIYIGEATTARANPLYQVIVAFLRERGMAGATGLARHRRLRRERTPHTTRLLRLSEDLPILIEVVDEEDRNPSPVPA
jgi:PII-like signaling protein